MYLCFPRRGGKIVVVSSFTLRAIFKVAKKSFDDWLRQMYILILFLQVYCITFEKLWDYKFYAFKYMFTSRYCYYQIFNDL